MSSFLAGTQHPLFWEPANWLQPEPRPSPQPTLRCVTSGPWRGASGSDWACSSGSVVEVSRSPLSPFSVWPSCSVHWWEVTRPAQERERRGDLGSPDAGLGRCGTGWRLCSYACCCLCEPGASAEESSVDSNSLPRLPCPPCRGGRKMPVKKKRKSSGVAAAVAEDGGLKKCKISRYLLPPLFSLPSIAGWLEENEVGWVSEAWAGERWLPRTPNKATW